MVNVFVKAALWEQDVMNVPRVLVENFVIFVLMECTNLVAIANNVIVINEILLVQHVMELVSANVEIDLLEKHVMNALLNIKEMTALDVLTAIMSTLQIQQLVKVSNFILF